MNKRSILIGVLLLTLSQAVMALDSGPRLQAARRATIAQYVLDLQKADYKDITTLFDKAGDVISTSKGRMPAKDFFYAFLPVVQKAETTLHQTFFNDDDDNRMAARFHFEFELKDGESGSGEYMDEFEFVPYSAKLRSVAMFENLKFA